MSLPDRAEAPSPELLRRVLSDTFATDVTVAAVERVVPWFVARVHLRADGTGVPPTVVVKWLRQNPQGFRTERRQLLTEGVALEFLGEIGLDIAPRLLAIHDEPDLLVMEDLAPREVLWDLLRTGDPRGREGLRRFAGAMGRLHAGTRGHADRYYARLASKVPVDRTRDARAVIADWTWQVPDFTAFGISAAEHAVREMEAVRTSFSGPGDFAAFTNGDAGANNFLIGSADGRITDWESAGYRHALLDLACLYVPGPMWMTVAEPDDEVAEDYRATARAGLPAVDDAVAFAFGLAASGLAMATERLQRLPMLDGRPPGHESRAQIVATLESAARTARRFDALPALADWAAGAAAVLRRRWPDADRAFPDAYTTRT